MRAEEPAPTLVVLYKDKSGNVRTQTDSTGTTKLNIRNDLLKNLAHIHLDTSELGTKTENLDFDRRKQSSDLSLPLSLGEEYADSEMDFDWEVVDQRPRRSRLESWGRVLIPMAGAIAALGGIESTTGLPIKMNGDLTRNDWYRQKNLDFTSTNLRINMGHYLVLATVSNLVEEVESTLANALEDQNHHLGGIIPPEWAAKGAIAVMLFGGGGLKSVGDKEHLSLGKATQFFAQSQTVKASNLFLGEVPGFMIDKVVGLSPEVRKITTAALGGAMTGGLYTLLSGCIEDYVGKATSDLHSKISNATILGVSTATTPFIKDFVGSYTDSKSLENIGTHAIISSIALPIAGSVYTILYKLDTNNNAAHLVKLAAGSFAKMAGFSLGNLVGRDTIKPYLGDSKATPLAMAVSYLSISFIANATLRYYDSTGTIATGAIDATSKHVGAWGPLGREFFLKLRDGIYISAIANGTTAIIEDITRRLDPQEQSIRLKLKVKPVRAYANTSAALEHEEL
ncbi:hypothetical protein [Parendozoicomonas sp. Alg238-R29]|uniref:hypothetical protein n=1 Tax=Parendozoicomonas sp. Alg238-R29 TaxID=2993446 RepID=UPI00248D4555|nr:hypothetical protein [Parendozoicomonas sp. Alg238-R29]